MISFFFFNDTATTEIYTLPYTTLFRSKFAHSLKLVLPRITAPAARSRSPTIESRGGVAPTSASEPAVGTIRSAGDRKSTRLNSSHTAISNAGSCLAIKLYTHEHDNTSY